MVVVIVVLVSNIDSITSPSSPDLLVLVLVPETLTYSAATDKTVVTMATEWL